ncbi:unnamed protein product [Ranitomeya imitator]|uniref:Uncharacterized protein n=1 Tax=Ranitomeya imitator TaxID=111125 RepID=A0ABN9LE66_9NEOB|nr:unnamed protein product [Ranitomeya imitator]
MQRKKKSKMPYVNQKPAHSPITEHNREDEVAQIQAMMDPLHGAQRRPLLVLACVTNPGDKRIPCVYLAHELCLNKLNRTWMDSSTCQETLDSLIEAVNKTLMVDEEFISTQSPSEGPCGSEIGHPIRIQSDNATAVAFINRQGGNHSRTAMHEWQQNNTHGAVSPNDWLGDKDFTVQNTEASTLSGLLDGITWILAELGKKI